MNLPYQLAQHMRQWPKSDRRAVERRIRQALITGNAWHWHEPQQLELGL